MLFPGPLPMISSAIALFLNLAFLASPCRGTGSARTVDAEVRCPDGKTVKVTVGADNTAKQLRELMRKSLPSDKGYWADEIAICHGDGDELKDSELIRDRVAPGETIGPGHVVDWFYDWRETVDGLPSLHKVTACKFSNYGELLERLQISTEDNSLFDSWGEMLRETYTVLGLFDVHLKKKTSQLWSVKMDNGSFGVAFISDRSQAPSIKVEKLRGSLARWFGSNDSVPEAAFCDNDHEVEDDHAYVVSPDRESVAVHNTHKVKIHSDKATRLGHVMVCRHTKLAQLERRVRAIFGLPGDQKLTISLVEGGVDKGTLSSWPEVDFKKKYVVVIPELAGKRPVVNQDREPKVPLATGPIKSATGKPPKEAEQSQDASAKKQSVIGKATSSFGPWHVVGIVLLLAGVVAVVASLLICRKNAGIEA